MPWVDLQTPDDYASIFYFTTSITGNAGGLDPNRPTVILLHPIFLDSTWVDIQFQDLRLYTSFNLVAFDMRSSGKSKCRLNPLHDSWVNAADLALCMQVGRIFALVYLGHALIRSETSPSCLSCACVREHLRWLRSKICCLVGSVTLEMWRQSDKTLLLIDFLKCVWASPFATSHHRRNPSKPLKSPGLILASNGDRMAYLEELVQGWCLSEDLMSSEDSGSHILELLYGLVRVFLMYCGQPVLIHLL